MRACGQKLVKFCTLTHIHTHKHTTAAKLVVRMFAPFLLEMAIFNI